MSGTESDPMLLAAEYALGTLDLAEMRDAEATMARDPAFAAEVALWDRRLSPLGGAVQPMQPPAAVWSRLALAAGIVADGGAAVRSPERARRGGRGFWPAATGLSLALAAGLAMFAFLPRPPAPGAEPARFAAALSPIGQPARFLAETRADGSMSITSLSPQEPQAGRSFELWALPQGATAPVSLGVLRPGERIAAPSSARPSAQEQLLVSDEPAGGSPTGAPTGPVLFGGTLAPLSPVATPGR